MSCMYLFSLRRYCPDQLRGYYLRRKCSATPWLTLCKPLQRYIFPTVTFVTVMEVFTNLVVALCVAYNCLKIIDVVDVVHLIAFVALHVGKGAAESVLCRVCRLIKFPKALVVKASFQKTW